LSVSSTSFYPSNSQSALFSVVRFLSPISFRSVSFPSFFLAVSTSYSSRYLQCLLYKCRRYTLTRSLHVSQPSPPSHSSRYLQCLPYNIVDALFNPSPSPLPFQSSPPSYSPRYLQRLLKISSIHSNPFLRPYLRFPHISVGHFQLLSPRLRQCTLVFRFYLLLILLGSLSVPARSIHLSQCRLLCPCVAYYADVYVAVDTSFISSSSFRLLAVSAVFPLQLFNTHVEPVFSMQFYSAPAFAFSCFTRAFSPFILSVSPTS
jgi:hypothetical protein